MKGKDNYCNILNIIMSKYDYHTSSHRESIMWNYIQELFEAVLYGRMTKLGLRSILTGELKVFT